MKRALVIILYLFLMFLLGCSVVNVVPRPGGSTQLSADGISLIANHAGLEMSAKMQDLQVPSHQMVENLTSFQITIDNGTADAVNIPLDSFILIDSHGKQYNAITPTEVRDIVKRDSPYLVPYPYVGYYYTEDYEKAGSFSSLESSLPFYAENHPQDIFTQALPQDTIIPGAHIAGLVYFVVDLSSQDGVELRVYRPGTALSSEPDFKFAFSVEKK